MAEPSLRLKTLCFLAVKKNFRVLEAQAGEVLPCCLLEELQTRLTVLQLNQIQPRLNSRGVSTLRGWRLLQIKTVGAAAETHSADEDETFWSTPCGDKKVPTEEEKTKVSVMTSLFTSVLYDLKNRHISPDVLSEDPLLFLSTAARHIHTFVLLNVSERLRSLTSEWRPVLQQLERRVHSLRLTHSLDASKPQNQAALRVLHRLLHHGRVRKVTFDDRCPVTLALILGTRGSRAPDASACSEDQEPAHKRARPDPGPGPGLDVGGCRRPHLESLELSQCQAEGVRVLCGALPSCSSLRSLTLHSLAILSEASARGLVRSLQQQSRSEGRGLLRLTVHTLPCPSLLEALLEACPRLQSLSTEVHRLPQLCTDPGPNQPQNSSEFPLRTLRIFLNQQLVPALLMLSLIRRCPRLQVLEVIGLRLQSEASYGRLLTTLSDSCRSLTHLKLEDVNLSDSLKHILLLLERTHLQKLTLKDCRLLEKQSDQEQSLKRLTTALANHPSLHFLSLEQNRIARHVPVLAQLFSPNSSLLTLDLRSNFIQASELLDFSRRLVDLRPDHRPDRRPTLDLRRNPGDRDPDSWRSAALSLAPHCELLLDTWSSRNTLVDHISNM